jgi:hypothetical protein
LLGNAIRFEEASSNKINRERANSRVHFAQENTRKKPVTAEIRRNAPSAKISLLFRSAFAYFVYNKTIAGASVTELSTKNRVML